MEIGEIIGIVLPIIFCCVGIALVVVLVQVVKTLKTARDTIDDLNKQLEPTLSNVQAITTDIKPACS